ncbi:MAG: hypothetical protein C5S40_05775 [ANME-2 cluster archaeon]|nr:hypothetical protein [ANME-2 cluster archaeon]
MRNLFGTTEAVPQSNSGEYTNQNTNMTNIQKKLKIPKILSSQKQIPQPNVQSNTKRIRFKSKGNCLHLEIESLLMHLI